MPPRAATTYEKQSYMKSMQSAVISSDLFGGALDETTQEALNTYPQNCTWTKIWTVHFADAAIGFPKCTRLKEFQLLAAS